MTKPIHYHIRAMQLAERLLKQAGEHDTPEGRHILKVVGKTADRAQRKADHGPANPDLVAWHKAEDAALEALSTYIRTRDTRLYGEARIGGCCTCLQPKRFEELGCGHWQSRKYWGTKFHPFNNHAQCWGCNSKMMGNGRMKDHEDYIILNHGPEWPAKLIFLTKTDKRERTEKELWAIAEEFNRRTANHLARESAVE
jgi:hypothetical protein